MVAGDDQLAAFADEFRREIERPLLADRLDHAVASGRLDTAPLYTHRYPLDRLADALDATRDKPEGFLKALVTYA